MDCKYYYIGRSDNLKVTGHYPQVILKKGYNPGPPNGHWEVHPRKFPNFKPNLELELHKKSKATDYLHFSDISGIIVSNKFKVILNNFKLPPHTFYPIKVYYKGELLEYYWLHSVIKDFWGWLDKDKSKGVIMDIKKKFQTIGEVNLKFSVKKIRELDDALPYYQNTKWEKIVFKKGFPKYDVYEIQILDYKTIISESLLNTLQEAGMTGFEVIPYEGIECG